MEDIRGNVEYLELEGFKSLLLHASASPMIVWTLSRGALVR